LGELIRNLYQQWGVICIELFRSNTPKSLCCKEFSQLVPLSDFIGFLRLLKALGSRLLIQLGKVEANS
jgi:hypothetical protein